MDDIQNANRNNVAAINKRNAEEVAKLQAAHKAAMDAKEREF